MKRVLVVLLLAAMAVYPPTSRACFCLIPEVAKSFKDARSVFVGETVQITEPKTRDEDAPLSERAHTIKFKLVRSWKGVPFAAPEFSILWLTNCYECLPLPRMNDTYLVFADSVPKDKTLSVVGMCNRTVSLRNDSGFLNESIDPARDMKQLDIIVNGLVRPAQ